MNRPKSSYIKRHEGTEIPSAPDSEIVVPGQLMKLKRKLVMVKLLMQKLFAEFIFLKNNLNYLKKRIK